MPTDRRQFLLATALLPSLSFAQRGGQSPEEGVHYRLVRPPQPVETGNKVEVLEFFWYGCPHCATFDPTLEGWRKKIPADVEYRRCAVAFDASRSAHSKIYYALEQLKQTDALHSKVFTVMHVNRKQMLDTNEIADFMAANGIDRKLWLDTFNSFSVATMTRRAAQTWAAYKLEGTPAVAIDGKFMTAPSMVGSREGTLAVMDFLIERSRKERGKR